MKFFCTTILLVFYLGLDLVAQSTTERQQKYLEEILLINIPQYFKENTRRVTFQDSTWNDWLKRTKELPPDFSQMPSVPFLPEPLILFKNGREQPITTPAQWQEKRTWIKEQYQHWVSGKVPPAPANFKVKVLSEKEENGTLLRMVELRFGPNEQARMTVELMIPKTKGPLPVYLTQWNHRVWAQQAVRRGYIGCVYAAADIKDDTEAYQAIYPNFDFSMLMRRAWGASRVVDYLLTLPEVNKAQIAITGHSRNGKQSLWAAAFDERIAAAIPTSSGTGGGDPWRYGDPQFASETLDRVTAWNGHWFHPRLRFFFGREDKLPVDQNLLMALVAPRLLLLHYAITERGLNPWANEQAHQSAKKVYTFLGAEQNIGVLPRYGEHALAARDIEHCIDFLDIHFKRTGQLWVNKLYYNYSFTDWAKAQPADSVAAVRTKPVQLPNKYKNIATFDAFRPQITDRLQWLLGEEPAAVRNVQVSPTAAGNYDWIARLTGQPEPTGAEIIRLGSYTGIGDNLSGVLYRPNGKKANQVKTARGKMPVVIFLHQYAYSTGAAWGYHKAGKPGNKLLFQTLIDKGFAVLAFDMVGFGLRIEESPQFYQRFPQWSKMGNMVADVRACVDALANFDYIDKDKIFLLGNALGGSVALFSAALDERIAGVAVLSAFSPWRTSNAQYPSIYNFSHLHGLMPRLGWYANQPQRVPLDYPEIIAAIAPRPLLIISPQLDRHADLSAIQETIKSVTAVYDLHKKTGQLQFTTPKEINRLTEPMCQEIANFYSKLL